MSAFQVKRSISISSGNKEGTRPVMKKMPTVIRMPARLDVVPVPAPKPAAKPVVVQVSNRPQVTFGVKRPPPAAAVQPRKEEEEENDLLFDSASPPLKHRAGEETGLSLRVWLMAWGLPGAIADVYEERGVRGLYPWQLACLRAGALQRAARNLVYTVPTSGGKTLVAELVLLRCVVQRRRTALLVLPYVSLVLEKAQGFAPFARRLGFVCESFHGSQGTLPLARGPPRLLVATPEKANGIVNALVEERRLSELGCVVVDEVHMVGDDGRGPTLEILLSKIVYLSSHPLGQQQQPERGQQQKELQQQEQEQEQPLPQIQIIAMSATVPNSEELGRWLQADVHCYDFRPVELQQYVKKGMVVCDAQTGRPVRTLAPLPADFDGTAALCAEVVPAHSVLVFCSTKHFTEKAALSLAHLLPQYARRNQSNGQQGEKKMQEDEEQAPYEQELRKRREELIDQLGQCGSGGAVPDTLCECVRAGVAYHHAGLMAEERALVEAAFRARTVGVLCCTSTLAAGVNLPARRVLIRSPYVGRDFMSAKAYRQMSGRAGRAGLDACGESILFADPRRLDRSLALARAAPEPVRSALLRDGARALRRLLLEGACLLPRFARADLCALAASTLAHTQLGSAALLPHIGPTVKELLANGFLSVVTGNGLETSNGEQQQMQKQEQQKQQKNKEENKNEDDDVDKKKEQEEDEQQQQYEVTEFGKATYHSALSPQEALLVREELAQARKVLVLEDELHLCYLLTPVGQLPSVDWVRFDAMLSARGDETPLLRVLALVGGTRGLVRARAQCGAVRAAPGVDAALARLYAATMLRELVRERPLADVAARYAVPRGVLQALMQGAAAFAFMTVAFCRRVGWWDLEALLAGYVRRLHLGVRPDVLPLTDIPGVGRARARALHRAGFRAVADVAAAAPETLAALAQLGPFGPGIARRIVRAARSLLAEQAQAMRQQAADALATLKDIPGGDDGDDDDDKGDDGDQDEKKPVVVATTTTNAASDSSATATTVSSSSSSLSGIAVVYNGEGNENSDDHRRRLEEEEEDDDVLFNRLDRERQDWEANSVRRAQETATEDDQGSLLDTDTDDWM